jgi:hypothetical protein
VGKKDLCAEGGLKAESLIKAETTMSTKHLTIFAFLFWTLGMSCSAETKQGPCKIPNGDSGGDGFVVEVGEKVHGKCKFVIEDFFGKKIIRANIEVVNTAEIPMHCHYYVAFFDKDGQLLGCASQGTSGDDGLKPGRNMQFGSCLIPLPIGTHEKVASYKVAFYESKSPIGK